MQPVNMVTKTLESEHKTAVDLSHGKICFVGVTPILEERRVTRMACT